MRLIPAIDLKDGRCVRLLRGDFAAETRYDAEPGTLLRRYRDFGADWVHVVDLDGALDGSTVNQSVIAQLSAMPEVSLQVGGGLRDRASLSRVFDLGAARGVVGSAAVAAPDEVKEWLRDYGAERIVLAFDVRLNDAGTPCVATHGWRRQSTLPLWDAVARFADSGLAHVLCTDVSRDGALSGPNLELYADAAHRFPRVAWQASGGVRDASDLRALAGCGSAAAISGKALLENLIPVEELRPFLPNA